MPNVEIPLSTTSIFLVLFAVLIIELLSRGLKTLRSITSQLILIFSNSFAALKHSIYIKELDIRDISLPLFKVFAFKIFDS